MRGNIEDMPIAIEIPAARVRVVQWGGMDVELTEIAQTIDMAPLYEGLPDNLCQCPHWGFVIRGRIRVHYPHKEEVFNAGDLYWAEPGHSQIYEAGTMYIEFSPEDQHIATNEVVER